MGLQVSFYTERSMFKQADFQYQMMLLSMDGGEDCETINVRPGRSGWAGRDVGTLWRN